MKRTFFYFLFATLFFMGPQYCCATDHILEVTDDSMSTEIPDLLGEEEIFAGEDLPEPAYGINDPLESLNRVFFSFNDKMYDWVLKPFSDLYIWALPYELRSSFDNLFANLAAPVRFINAFLQGDFNKSRIILERFLINSTAGVLGMTDVAKLDFDLEPQKADFGQTLGRWGIGSGPYLYWPILGPSSLRDTFGFGLDIYLHPMHYALQDWQKTSTYYSTENINYLSLHQTFYEDLRQMTFDPYVAVRRAYIDYRTHLVKSTRGDEKSD